MLVYINNINIFLCVKIIQISRTSHKDQSVTQILPIRIRNGGMYKVSVFNTFSTIKVFFHGVTENTLCIMSIALRGGDPEVPGSLAFS